MPDRTVVSSARDRDPAKPDAPAMAIFETWKPITETAGRYEVSDLGRVRSTASGLVRKAPIQRDRYRKLVLYVDGVALYRWVHRLVCTAFHGYPIKGQVTRHLNGDPLDNRAENFAWGSVSENQLDSARHGTHHNAEKTHCKWGHPFTPANTLPNTAPNSRRCRACRDAANAKRGTKRATTQGVLLAR